MELILKIINNIENYNIYEDVAFCEYVHKNLLPKVSLSKSKKNDWEYWNRMFIVTETNDLNYLSFNFCNIFNYLTIQASIFELNFTKTSKDYLQNAKRFLDRIPLNQELSVCLTFHRIYNDLSKFLSSLMKKKLIKLSWVQQNNEFSFNSHICSLLLSQPSLQTVSFYKYGYQYYFQSLVTSGMIPLIVKFIKEEIKIQSHKLPAGCDIKVILKS